MSDNNMLNFDLSTAEGDLDAVLGYISDMGLSVDMAAAAALPKLGREMAEIIHRDGPRSQNHRGPSKKPRKLGRKETWRHPTTHAVDTIKASRVRWDKETGTPYVVVGPSKGDNSPSFYLKFHEYGKLGETGTPFIRPARRIIMSTRAAPVVVEAINAALKKRGTGK